MSAHTSVVQQILVDHGHKALRRLVGRLPTAVWEAAKAALDKVVICRTAEAGFVRLRCDQCGHMKTICFTCKSRLCPSCGWNYAQQFTERLQGRLIKGRYRHIVFAVPSELRELFFWHRESLPVACHAAAAATMEAFQTLNGKRELVPGILATCHTFGRNLRFHVHVHLLVTEGALQVDGVWQPIRYFSGRQYRKYWQYHLLTKLRQTLPADDPWQAKIGRLFRNHPTGFIVNLETSHPNVRMAVSYCCRYMARPPMGDRRIMAYDGKHVTFEYKDYRTAKVQSERCTAYGFVRLLLQHTLPRYARNIHYYGLYRSQARRTWFARTRRVSRYPQNIPEGAGKPLTWRQRIIKAFKVDPINCPQCGTKMVVHDIHLPGQVRAPPGWAMTKRECQLQIAFQFA